MKLKYRKGIFFVVYKKQGGRTEYLVLHRILHWRGWEFPKAGLEEGEQDEQAVRREVKEETGLKIKKIIRFREKGRFRYYKEFSDRKGIKGQSWKLFGVEVGNGKVKIDKTEHDKYRWLDFKSAYKTLKWPSQKECLKIVEGFLGSKA